MIESVNKIKIGLFATCLADSMRPSVDFATLQLLENAGCHVNVPKQQSCCAQPAYNSGDFDNAKRILMPLFESFADCDYLIAPSASCVGMLKKHLPKLFPEGDEYHQQALTLAQKSHELTWFLVNIMDYRPDNISLSAKITYHASCSSLREVEVGDAPYQLLKAIPGVQLCEFTDSEVCCGFGGLFCVKYPPIAKAMVDNKCRHIGDSGGEILVSGDLGCLLNIAGRFQRQNSPIRCYHIAEVLAGLADTSPAIGE